MSYQWAPYVPVAERRETAAREMRKLKRNGVDVQPVEIEGRKIAKSFWGQAWCDHIESFHDHKSRLPRGRTYARNGSVCHLNIESGRVDAIVSGSGLYNIEITVKALNQSSWDNIKAKAQGEIGSLVELLQGQFSVGIMGVVSDSSTGLFPKVSDIELHCDCPDYAVMCKHVAAVLYGVGARLDNTPDALFKLRGVDPNELIDLSKLTDATTSTSGTHQRISDGGLDELFDIEMD